MSPDKRAILLEQIDNHHAAMRAQVERPDVPLEFLNRGGGWQSNNGMQLVVPGDGVNEARWHRLAPVPKMVDLDQGDFLGPNRVTHLRPICNTELVYSVGWVNAKKVCLQSTGEIPFDRLRTHWECSRDGGATWQKCEKASV